MYRMRSGPDHGIDYNITIRPCNNIRKIYDGSVGYANGNRIPWYSARHPFKELNEDTICRGMVNQIRHAYTDYDRLLRVYNINSYDLYRSYKNSVLKAIGEEYPFLRKACNAQMRAVVMVKKVKKRKHNYFLPKNQKSKRKNGG